jgi:ubiquinone/menaquinone biosynthesis C-methylase UbiE
VTGLDISHTMVEIASDNARAAGLPVDFRQGDVADLPFPPGRFDLVVCQAAFKNFTEPVRALDEMHRVLRPGGTAVIQDLSPEATRTDIEREVRQMRLSRWNTLVTRFTLGMLRRRAHTADQFRRLAQQSAFGTCQVQTDGVGLEVRLTRTS